MKWLGVLAFFILIYYSSYYPGKINELEKKVKKLEKKLGKKAWEGSGREGNEMSRLMEDLVGKRCRLETEDEELSSNCECDVLDVDEDWVKLAYEDKNKGRVTKLIRVDAIVSVDVVEGI